MMIFRHFLGSKQFFFKGEGHVLFLNEKPSEGECYDAYFWSFFVEEKDMKFAYELLIEK